MRISDWSSDVCSSDLQVMPKGQKKPWVYKVHISEWRKHFLGRGGGFKKTEAKKNYLPGHDPKELAIQRCAQYGWHTDIADAPEAVGIPEFGTPLIPDTEPPWRDRKGDTSRKRVS